MRTSEYVENIFSILTVNGCISAEALNILIPNTNTRYSLVYRLTQDNILRKSGDLYCLKKRGADMEAIRKYLSEDEIENATAQMEICRHGKGHKQRYEKQASVLSMITTSNFRIVNEPINLKRKYCFPFYLPSKYVKEINMRINTQVIQRARTLGTLYADDYAYDIILTTDNIFYEDEAGARIYMDASRSIGQQICMTENSNIGSRRIILTKDLNCMKYLTAFCNKPKTSRAVVGKLYDTELFLPLTAEGIAVMQCLDIHDLRNKVSMIIFDDYYNPTIDYDNEKTNEGIRECNFCFPDLTKLCRFINLGINKKKNADYKYVIHCGESYKDAVLSLTSGYENIFEIQTHDLEEIYLNKEKRGKKRK